MGSSEKSMELVGSGFWEGYGSWRLFGFRWLAVLLTSVSQPLLSAPYNWWPWHWFAWVPFFWAIQAQGGRGRWLLGLGGGTVANFMIFYWVVNLMPNFSNISFWLAFLLTTLLCCYLSLLWVFLALAIPRLIRTFPRAWVLLAPCLLVALEFVMPQLFPYMQGVSHYQVIPLVQIASITGIYGVSFLVFWSNCILFQWWLWHREGKGAPVSQMVALAITVALVLTYGFWRISLYQSKLATAKHRKVGLIQSNYTPADHNKSGPSDVFLTYLELSRQAAKKGADWIVWSEGEFKFALSTSAARTRLAYAASQVKRPILLGGYDYIMRKNGPALLFNSAIHIHPKYGLGQRYDKQILVPFGEYMPGQTYLDFIYKKIHWYSRFTKGDTLAIQKLDNIPYGFLICYEAIYPSRVRRSVQAGAKVLVNITYDAWFGKTTAPYQHLMLAAIRSAEYGVPLIRLATTGSSTVVNALGKTDTLSPLFQRKILIYDLPIVQLPSLYANIGDVFAWLCLLVSCAGLFLMSRTKEPTLKAHQN